MKKLISSTLLLFSVLFVTSCVTNDDDGNGNTETSITYQLSAVSNSGVSGTAKFIKNDDDSVTIELQLNGTSSGGMHPAHIHYNTAAEGGGVALTLGTVDGATGFSTVTVTALDDATPITYEELLEFDGYINVHTSTVDLTVVAQGDIGQNALTGISANYVLNEVDSSGISGTLSIFERLNGEALAIIQLSGTSDGDMHAAHIHSGSVAEAPGAVLLTFTSVDGATGLSVTNISALDDLTPFDYQAAFMVDGYVNIHDANNPSIIVAQGDVGANALQ